jgi:hypothetical protein
MKIVSRSVQKKLHANGVHKIEMLPIYLFLERYFITKKPSVTMAFNQIFKIYQESFSTCI